VTLILYKIGDQWWKEPALNLLAAAAQFSSYTHVELAIGESSGDGGQMANVARIYNDNVGVVCRPTQTEEPEHLWSNASTDGLNPPVFTGTLPAHWSQSRGEQTLMLCTVVICALNPHSTLRSTCVLAVHLPVHRLQQRTGAAHASVCACPSGKAI